MEQLLEIIITSLIALGAAFLGGFLGYAGSMKAAKLAIEANRKKDNFHIAKDSLETNMRSLSSLKHMCDFDLSVGYPPSDPQNLSATFRKLVTGICDVIVETPWVYSSTDIEKLAMELRSNLGIVEATFNNKVRPQLQEILGQDTIAICKTATEASRALNKNVENIQLLAENELNRLIKEYKTLMKQEIPE